MAIGAEYHPEIENFGQEPPAWLDRFLQDERQALDVFLRQRHARLLSSFTTNPEPVKARPYHHDFSSPNSFTADPSIGEEHTNKPTRGVDATGCNSTRAPEVLAAPIANPNPDPNWPVDDEELDEAFKEEERKLADHKRAMMLEKATSNIQQFLLEQNMSPVLSEEMNTIATGASASRRANKDLSLGARLHRFVLGPNLELLSGTLILANTLVMAAQRQYDGLDVARKIAYNGTTATAAEEWPAADTVFEVLEWIFGLAFLAEVGIRVGVLRRKFFKDPGWALFDMAIALLWIVDRIAVATWFLNPMVLRLARLARMLRLLRIVRWVKFFDPLCLMIKSIRASFTILVWSLMLLFVLMTVIAMIIAQFLESYIVDTSISASERTEIFESWGDFTRAFVSMFEITLANWGPPCWLLVNNVGEGWGYFVVLYKCSFGFAVVQVIISVFIQQTFKTASRDDEMMIKEKVAATESYLQSLERLFLALDEDGDGTISWTEFSSVLSDSRMKAWFAALEVDASELEGLFGLLDDGGVGVVSRPEFIKGVKRLRGGARSMDLIELHADFKKLSRQMKIIDGMLCFPGAAMRRVPSDYTFQGLTEMDPGASGLMGERKGRQDGVQLSRQMSDGITARSGKLVCQTSSREDSPRHLRPVQPLGLTLKGAGMGHHLLVPQHHQPLSPDHQPGSPEKCLEEHIVANG